MQAQSSTSNTQITFTGVPPGNPYLLKRVEYPVLAQKLYPNAQPLTKEQDTDVGYDVTLISRKDNRTEDEQNELSEFETGWIVVPPPGYHLELVAKEDLERTGYELVSGAKVIDPTNRAPLVVTLRKYKEGDDLELPYVAVRLIVRKTEYCHIAQVTDIETSSLTGTVKTMGAGRMAPAYDDRPEKPVSRSKKGGKATNMF